MDPATHPTVADERLEALFRHLRSANPFTDDRGDGPAAAAADVPAIHRAAFERLTGLCAESGALRRGIGAVLAGEPGSGKSHILARLSRWASGDGQACFLTVTELPAAPAAVPAAVVQTIVGSMACGATRRWHATPLFRLAHGAILAAVGGDRGFHPWRRLEQKFAALSSRLGGPGMQATADLIFRFYRSTVRARQGKEDGVVAGLVVRHLSGLPLDATQARWLNLPPARPGEPGPVEATLAARTLAALAALASADGRPFVLALDAADTLPPDAAATLARVVAAALDAAPNLFAVTTAGPTTLAGWRTAGLAPGGTWDRLARYEIPLDAVGVDGVHELVRKRLDAFFEPSNGCGPLDRVRSADPLFPLGAGWFGREFAAGGAWRPRDVLRRAAEEWRRAQHELARHRGPEWLDDWAEGARTAGAGNQEGSPASPWGGAGEAPVESSLTPAQLHAAISGRARVLSPAREAAAKIDVESSLTYDQLRAAIAARPSAPRTGAADRRAPGDFTPVDLYPEGPDDSFPDPHDGEPGPTRTPSELRDAACSPFHGGLAKVDDAARTLPAHYARGDHGLPNYLPNEESHDANSTPGASDPSETIGGRTQAVDAAVDGAVSGFLAEFREAPGEADRVADLLYALLTRCRDAYPRYGILQVDRVPPWRPSLPACDLDLRQRKGEKGLPLRSGVLVLTSSRLTSITNLLRRLVEDRHPFDRLFLVTEERVGLPLGPRGQKYLDALRVRTSHRLYTLELGPPEYAELAALDAVVRRAAAGTLAAVNDTGRRKPVTEAEAVDSHHRRRRFLDSRLLSTLLFDAPQTHLLVPVQTRA